MANKFQVSYFFSLSNDVLNITIIVFLESFLINGLLNVLLMNFNGQLHLWYIINLNILALCLIITFLRYFKLLIITL